MLDKLNKQHIRQKLLNPFIINVNPNYITFIALVSAICAGILFYYDMILIAVFMVFVNGFLDILDGEISKKYKRETKLGDFLDHMFDRISDMIILLGITLSSYVPDVYGYGLMIMTLLVSYLGTQSHALLGKRNYSGMMGRADRLILIIVFSLLTLIYINMLYYGVIIMIIFSIITFIQRFYRIYAELI